MATAEETTQAQQVLFLLTFRLEKNSTMRLLDTQSVESKEPVSTVRNEVSKVFALQFESFINITGVELWNVSGPMGVNIDLLFRYPGPMLCQVVSTLYSLALVPSFFTFSVDPRSIQERSESHLLH
ncbi:hypothetical protein GN956_G26560 [Arapaima gigas]